MQRLSDGSVAQDANGMRADWPAGADCPGVVLLLACKRRKQPQLAEDGRCAPIGHGRRVGVAGIADGDGVNHQWGHPVVSGIEHLHHLEVGEVGQHRSHRHLVHPTGHHELHLIATLRQRLAMFHHHHIHCVRQRAHQLNSIGGRNPELHSLEYAIFCEEAANSTAA